MDRTIVAREERLQQALDCPLMFADCKTVISQEKSSGTICLLDAAEALQECYTSLEST